VTARAVAVGDEQLRRTALEGGATQGHFGLLLLLREGIATWMHYAPDSPSVIVDRERAREHNAAGLAGSACRDGPRFWPFIDQLAKTHGFSAADLATFPKNY
jgi:hypothetical protein